MNARQLWFVEPAKVEIREQPLPPPGRGQVLLKTLYSGISSGTEMLAYRGQLPDSMALDESLAAYAQQPVSYPLQYGYASVGRIEQTGAEVDSAWQGRTVFAFLPHASHHLCTVDALVPLPENMNPKSAVFLANMETAVSLVQDGNPRLGERVLMLGQGVVGLLVSSLLARFPLGGLYAVEGIDGRRVAAEQAGVSATFSPDIEPDMTALSETLAPQQPRGGADLVFELSGAPAALNLAVDLCAYSGRIVVGSWYGNKRAEINLGERFHRNRISIVSSQVSTIAPSLSGRWDKARRFALAWEMIKKCQPEQFISHCLPFAEAADAYRLLDTSPEQALQVIFDYQD
ncbi:MAG: zinc-binding dehydrogenase [Pseudohongiellaceae bacterium]